MKTNIVKSIVALFCVCVTVILMGAFFSAEAHAAVTATGTTTKREQTVKVDLKRGMTVITFSDKDCWVFSQLQTSANNKKGAALAGACAIANMNKKTSFAVPVTKAGTYYVYLHGKTAGAKYTVQQFPAGGKLKAGIPMVATSFMDNQTVANYKINIPKNGRIKVTVRDASYRYKGYSKIRLIRDGNIVSGEEHLLKGYGFTTTYGVKKGEYTIGVRSSSELYKISYEFKSPKINNGSEKKDKAKTVKYGKRTVGLVLHGSTKNRWYLIKMPKKTKAKKGMKVTVRCNNSNANIRGGIKFRLYYAIKKGKKTTRVDKAVTLNNASRSFNFTYRKGKTRLLRIKVTPVGKANGTYSIIWK